MTHFSRHLNLGQSAINNIFNTVTKEGQELLYFPDVVDIIHFFEQNKDNHPEDSLRVVPQEGLNLSVFEIKIILENFEEIRKVNNFKQMIQLLDGSALMFVVDYESSNGPNSAPNLFSDVNLELLFQSIKTDPVQLKTVLHQKVLTRIDTENINNNTHSLQELGGGRRDSDWVNRGHPPSRVSLQKNSQGEPILFN
jgi:hypothetical protein